ncbi:hypothetical protein LNP74_19720 [Klebsiella pneumoniae subsp. pneumoniae]|nr:hypothetical protein [Klebsiella pneumoniae subsp. pneumoniae]
MLARTEAPAAAPLRICVRWVRRDRHRRRNHPPSADIQARILEAKSVVLDDSWQERAAEAEWLKIQPFSNWKRRW